ncbi:hypothetical protein AB4211_23075 [Vibrio lentus]
MKKTLISIIFASSLLTGCASNDLNIQLTPDETSSIELKKEPAITYILSSGLDVSDIRFAHFDRQVTEHTYEMLDWQYNNDILRVERRTHNGIAGSGVIYEVLVTTSPDKLQVTFEPKKLSKYQEGVVFPYPVPDFDIHSFLSNSYYTHNFEIDSQYSPESVKSSFQRLLSNAGANGYNLDIPNIRALASVEVFPYRDGSKVSVETDIKTFSVSDNKINLKDVYSNIENKIAAVVND